jgi:hypothetical protein
MVSIIEHRQLVHPYIAFSALPCDSAGNFISLHSHPSPPVAPDAMEDNPWHPFEGRLSFDWAHYNFVELQALERKIDKGLDLWLAAKLEAGDHGLQLLKSMQQSTRFKKATHRLRRFHSNIQDRCHLTLLVG